MPKYKKNQYEDKQFAQYIFRQKCLVCFDEQKFKILHDTTKKEQQKNGAHCVFLHLYTCLKKIKTSVAQRYKEFYRLSEICGHITSCLIFKSRTNTDFSFLLNSSLKGGHGAFPRRTFLSSSSMV